MSASPFIFGALGDSISTAYNALGSGDNLNHSWATSPDASSGVKSHLQRLRAALPHVRIEAINAAKNGARSSDLAGQVSRLLPSRPDYVTLLIGANDLLAWVFAPDFAPLLARFKHDVEAAVAALVKANARVMILLSGIPDQIRVIDLGLQRFQQAPPWASLLLSQPAMMERLREAYRKRWVAANAALRDIAVAVPGNIKFIGRTPSFKFDLEHLSPIDFYHPSAAGQALLAAVTWEQGWFP